MTAPVIFPAPNLLLTAPPRSRFLPHIDPINAANNAANDVIGVVLLPVLDLATALNWHAVVQVADLPRRAAWAAAQRVLHPIAHDQYAEVHFG